MVIVRAAVDGGSLQKFMQRILGTKQIDDLGLFALGNRREGKRGLHLLAADDLLQNIQCHLSFTQFFLPQFSGNEAELQTERLLQLVFGCLDVQRRPQKIEPACIARALGFRIQFAALTESGSLTGRCVFADADVQLFDTALRQHRLFRIPGRTILLEQRMRNRTEAVRAAAAREIVHAYFYRLAYAFFAASRRNIPSFRLSDAAALIRQTDRRTDQLAMCILMPREAVRQKVQEYRAAFSGQPESAYRKPLIRHTAVFFGVSDAFCAARLQMLGLMRPEAEPAAER